MGTGYDAGQFTHWGQLADARAIPALVELLHQPALAEHLVTPLLSFGQQHAPKLVRLVSTKLEPTESLKTRRYAAEILTALGDTAVRRYLPAIILDWIAFVSDTDDTQNTFATIEVDKRLRSMAVNVGMNSHLLDLAIEALGHTWHIRPPRGPILGSIPATPTLRAALEDRSAGGFLGVHYYGGMRAIQQLCRLRKDLWSSAILYRVAKKQDAQALTGGSSDYDNEPFYTTLSFDIERRTAHQELSRRRCANTDPATQLSSVGKTEIPVRRQIFGPKRIMSFLKKLFGVKKWPKA